MDKKRHCYICRRKIRRWQRRFGPVHTNCLKREFDRGLVELVVRQPYSVMFIPAGGRREYLH